MLERAEGAISLRPRSLGADKAYGSGAFLSWLQTQGIQLNRIGGLCGPYSTAA